MASGPAQFDKIRLGIRHPALVLQRARTRGATRSHPTEGSLAATRGSGAARAHQVHRVLHAPLGRAQADVRVPRDVDALRAHVRSLQEHRAPAAPGARQPRGRFDKKLFLTRGPPGRAFNSERLPARPRRWRLETLERGHFRPCTSPRARACRSREHHCRAALRRRGSAPAHPRSRPRDARAHLGGGSSSCAHACRAGCHAGRQPTAPPARAARRAPHLWLSRAARASASGSSPGKARVQAARHSAGLCAAARQPRHAHATAPRSYALRWPSTVASISSGSSCWMSASWTCARPRGVSGAPDRHPAPAGTHAREIPASPRSSAGPAEAAPALQQLPAEHERARQFTASSHSPRAFCCRSAGAARTG